MVLALVAAGALLTPVGEGLRAAAALELRDDLGRTLRLAGPPQRIASLAPHATEMLFDAGAGDQLAIVDLNSDRPPDARALPRLSTYPQVDLERLILARPDLIVVWGAALSAASLRRLESIAPVFVSQPRRLDDIAPTLERFARLARSPQAGLQAAEAAQARLRQLRARWSRRAPVRVFYQVWRQPLITISDADVIGDAIRSCGARNVFGHLAAAAPIVDPEAVVAAAPEVVVAAEDPQAAARWRDLGLGRTHGVVFANIDAGALQRPTRATLDAVEHLCQTIDRARSGDVAR